MHRKSLLIVFACLLFTLPVGAADETETPSFLDSIVTAMMDAVCELGGTLVPIGCEAAGPESSEDGPEPPPAELGGTLVPIG